jgi:hypothetical protein
MGTAESVKDGHETTQLERKKGDRDPRKLEDLLKIKAEGMSQTSTAIGLRVKTQNNWGRTKSLVDGVLMSREKELEGLRVDPALLLEKGIRVERGLVQGRRPCTAAVLCKRVPFWLDGM